MIRLVWKGKNLELVDEVGALLDVGKPRLLLFLSEMQEGGYELRLGLVTLLVLESRVLLDLELNISIAVRMFEVEGQDELSGFVRLQDNDTLK